MAERLLLKSGDESAVSIRAIAEAVGVTPPSIYLHFEDKDALLLAVCAEHFAKLDEVSEAAVVGVKDPMERIERRGRAYIQFGLDNPEPYRIMFMTRTASSFHLTDDELAEMAAFDHLRQDVEAAMAAGQMPKGDSFAIGCGLWAVVHGITSLLIAKPNFPWPPLEEFIAAAIGAASAKSHRQKRASK